MERKPGELSKRLRIVDRPYPVRNENGDDESMSRDAWAYPPDEDGWVELLVEGRFKYWVRQEVLDANTHLPGEGSVGKGQSQQ